MNFKLDNNEIDLYERDGIIFPRKLWCEANKDQCVKIIEDCYIKNIDTSLSDRVRHQSSVDLLNLLRSPRITDPVSCILGDDILIWRTAFFCKKPFGEGQKEIPWHQDTYSWSLNPMKACTVWIAIDDVDKSNGCMSVVPGSHNVNIDHVRTEDHQEFTMQIPKERLDLSNTKQVTLRSGEFAIFSEKLLHYSPINFSNRRRCGLAIRLIPSSVKVLEYDCDKHILIPIKGNGNADINRIQELDI